MTAPEQPLNTIQRPQYPCPSCGSHTPMVIYRTHIRRACGHTTTLPPIAPRGRRP